MPTSWKFYKMLLLAKLQNFKLSYQNFLRRGNVSLGLEKKGERWIKVVLTICVVAMVIKLIV